MITLGIETSCDETALCLLETKENGGKIEYKILGNIVHSQIDAHREFGGVFPMLAKREHIKNLPILFKKIKEETGIDESKIDKIAVTQGPGLEPALWTGILFAKEIGEKNNIPVVPINHMEGHIAASLLDESEKHNDFKELKDVKFPAIAVLISGGHTEIVKIEGIGKYEVIGKTKDDALGEAFDKVARMIGLPYPGGPEISKLAEEARIENTSHEITLPRPMIHTKDMDFSFSGLKTSVLYTIQKIGALNDNQKKDLAREFEDSVTEVLISKTEKAIDLHAPDSLIIGGGVIANKHIREAFVELARRYSLPLYLPHKGLSGDNALMIALVGAIKPATSAGFRAEGNLPL